VAEPYRRRRVKKGESNEAARPHDYSRRR